MSLLQNILTRLAAAINVEPKIGIAIADDGTGSAIDVGKPTPLRADPTTGALIVTGASGASLGAVTQGTGDTTKPWYMQGVSGGVAERLAAFAQFPATIGQKTAALSLSVTLPSDFTTLTDLLAYTRPQSTAPTNVAPKTVPTGTAEVIAASTAATRYVRVTSDFANTKTVYIGRVGVTTTNGQPLGPGDVYTNRDIDNAALLFCISADAAQVLRIEVL